MSKRSVSFIKPDEPSFLKKLKSQVGYQEGPTIDTKREELETFCDNELEYHDEEQPTVVVLKSGDLTAEEVAIEKNRLEQEEASAPADLSKPIVFKIPIKEVTEASKTSKKLEAESNKNKPKKALDKRLLSFDNEEDDDM